MDRTASRHRRSTSSSDRLLGLFTFSPSSNGNADDELNEAELFWSGDIPETENQRLDETPQAEKNQHQSLPCPKRSGILAVLSEPEFISGGRSILYRKPYVTTSSSRMIPSIPRPPGQNPQDREYFSQSMPSRKFQQSAPVKVPILSSKTTGRRSNGEFAFVDDDIEDDNDMLPPHEIVTRGSGVSPKTTFSVLEGAGRTLKGRDLRQFWSEVIDSSPVLSPQRRVLKCWINSSLLPYYLETREFSLGAIEPHLLPLLYDFGVS